MFYAGSGRDGVLRSDIGDTKRGERHKTGLAEPAKGREGDSPLPLQFVMPVSHTSPALTEPGSSVFPTGRRDGALRSDIGDTERGERIFRKRPQGARSEARAGSLRRRGGNIRSTASRTNTSQLRSTTPLTKTKKLNTKALIPKNQGFICARYWDRTSIVAAFPSARGNKKRLLCRGVSRGVTGSSQPIMVKHKTPQP